MLKALVINPDPGLENDLDAALRETGAFGALHTCQDYPTASTLERLVRLHAPEVVFVEVHDLKAALRVASQLDDILPDVPVVAFGNKFQQEAPLELMRAGIRELLEPPFTRDAILTMADRLEHYLMRHPLRVHSTDQIYSFLPAKPGAGTTTLATNTSIAVSRYKERQVLLMDCDLHNGLVGFMLSLRSPHGIADALEQSVSLDETLWPQLVAKKDGLDILASTGAPTGYRINPADLENLIRVARRLYQVVFVDLPGNIAEPSFDIMQESKQIFLVATAEVAVLHLARKKLEELTRLHLKDRVRLILNRWTEKSLIGRSQIEEMLAVPVEHTFANEYQAIYRTQLAGKAIARNSKLGGQIDNLARDILGLEVSDQPWSRSSILNRAARVANRWRGKIAGLKNEEPQESGCLPPASGGSLHRVVGRAPSRRSPIPAANPFSGEEMDKILDACSKSGELSNCLRALALLLRYGGFRLQDAVALPRDRVVDTRLIVSGDNAAESAGKELPAAVVEALASCSTDGSNRFFPDRGGDRQQTIQFWRSRLDEVFNAAGIADGDAIRFRDTYAVEMLKSGEPLETVSVCLGHKNLTATRRRYGQWIPNRCGGRTEPDRSLQRLASGICQGRKDAIDPAGVSNG